MAGAKHPIIACCGIDCGFDKETGERDSFVLHRCVLPNQAFIRENGLDAFLTRQSDRIAFLESALEKYDDGRSKNLFCIAAALISVENLNESLRRADGGEDIKAVLKEYAENEGQELRLRK